MLITKLAEIKAILPGQKWDSISSLSSLLQEEEDGLLATVLGDSLLDKVIDDYEAAVASATDGIVSVTTETLQTRVIKLCQKVEFYLMLANNSGLFTLSFNKGGGLNTMTADDYGTPSNDQVKRWERDAWNKAHRCVDMLLKLLEKDAQSASPVYLSYWKSSKYFYRKANLLFTTAEELQDYLDIKSSREKFIQLLPDIKYVQDTYITPRVGSGLMKALLGRKYGEEGSGSGSGSGEGEDLMEQLGEKLRMACALYVENDQKDMKREESLNHAEMQVNMACKLVEDNVDYFKEIAPVSPLYPEEETAATETADDGEQEATYDPNDSTNAVFAPFHGLGLNRY